MNYTDKEVALFLQYFEDTGLIPKPKNFLQDMTTTRYREGIPINL